jgi:hypothetical protein
MTSPRLIAWIERLAWIGVYGGLLSMLLGHITREVDVATGTLLLALGGMAVVAGALLIVLRSRLRGPGDPPAAQAPSHPSRRKGPPPP